MLKFIARFHLCFLFSSSPLLFIIIILKYNFTCRELEVRLSQLETITIEHSDLIQQYLGCKKNITCLQNAMQTQNEFFSGRILDLSNKLSLIRDGWIFDRASLVQLLETEYSEQSKVFQTIFDCVSKNEEQTMFEVNSKFFPNSLQKKCLGV